MVVFKAFLCKGGQKVKVSKCDNEGRWVGVHHGHARSQREFVQGVLIFFPRSRSSPGEEWETIWPRLRLGGSFERRRQPGTGCRVHYSAHHGHPWLRQRQLQIVGVPAGFLFLSFRCSRTDDWWKTSRVDVPVVTHRRSLRNSIHLVHRFGACDLDYPSSLRFSSSSIVSDWNIWIIARTRSVH